MPCNQHLISACDIYDSNQNERKSPTNPQQAVAFDTNFYWVFPTAHNFIQHGVTSRLQSALQTEGKNRKLKWKFKHSPAAKAKKMPGIFSDSSRTQAHTLTQRTERNGNGNARSRILICMRNFACELYAKNGAHMSVNWRLWQHPTPHNEPPKKPPNPLHAPMWCALEFHAFICKDYEMRPVAAKVLYALPAAGAAFSFSSGCVRGFCYHEFSWIYPSPPTTTTSHPFGHFLLCLLVRPSVRPLRWLVMHAKVCGKYTDPGLQQQTGRWEWHAKYFCIKMFAHQHGSDRNGAVRSRVLAASWQLHLTPWSDVSRGEMLNFKAFQFRIFDTRKLSMKFSKMFVKLYSIYMERASLVAFYLGWQNALIVLPQGLNVRHFISCIWAYCVCYVLAMLKGPSTPFGHDGEYEATAAMEHISYLIKWVSYYYGGRALMKSDDDLPHSVDYWPVSWALVGY